MTPYLNWKSVKEAPPEAGELYLGYDCFYGNVHAVSWDGVRIDDDGNIHMLPVDGNDDVDIILYTEIPMPSSKLIEAASK